MKTIEREWDWWAYHYRVRHRSQIPGIEQWDDDLVEMIVSVLRLQPGEKVLDLACGSGEHAWRLAQRGMAVQGVDIAPSLIEYCQLQQSWRKLNGSSLTFEVGDMRELAIEGEFDAVVMLSGSFGFFDDVTNMDVLARMARSLKPGGRLLVDVHDPAEMVVRPPRRSWSAYAGGYGLRTTWWEPETCTYVSEFCFIDEDGVCNTAAQPERIRVYSLPEWRAMLAGAGLAFTAALADTKLPPVPYSKDHYGNLLIVAAF